MITRLNIIRNSQNELILENPDLIPKNWILEIKDNKIYTVGLSKANSKRERISMYDLKEGSLFLHNSSFDFYSYFRDKETQSILDKYGIQKMVAIENNLFITLHVVNGKVTNPILYLHGFNLINTEKSNFNITDENNEYFQVKLEFIRDRNVSIIPYLIQMGKDEYNNILYIGKGKTLEELDQYIKPEHKFFNNNDFLFSE